MISWATARQSWIPNSRSGGRKARSHFITCSAGPVRVAAPCRLNRAWPCTLATRLDARATARDRSASGLADDSRLLGDRPRRQAAATRPPAARYETTPSLETPELGD